MSIKDLSLFTDMSILDFEDSVLSKDSLILFLHKHIEITDTIARRFNLYSKNISGLTFRDASSLVKDGNELDFYYQLMKVCKGSIIILLNNLTELEPLVQALDLNHAGTNFHLFHASQRTVNTQFGQMISDRNKSLFNLSVSGTQSHLGDEPSISRQLFDSYRLGNVYRDPEALIEPLKMATCTIIDLSVMKQMDVPGRELISSSGLSSETANQIAFSAGNASNNRIFVISGFDLLSEPTPTAIDTVTQIIYYFLQGKSTHTPMDLNEENATSYLVESIDGFEHIEFLKFHQQNEWYVKYPMELPDSHKMFKLIPCNYFDYEYSAAGELSPRLYEIFMALHQFRQGEALA